MTDDGELRDWLKWIAGGIIGFLVLFWQWMERKIERQQDRTDKLRDDTRTDRHKLAGDIQHHIKTIEEELEDHGTRLTKLEKKE